MKALTGEQEHLSYEFGPFRLDPRERALLRDGAPVPLLPKSFDALFVLVRNSGRLLDKEFLLAEIWPDAHVEENNLAHAISDIRKALGEGPKDQHYVVTVPRRGYRFAASVRTLEGSEHRAAAERRAEPGDAFEGFGASAQVRAVAVLPFTYLGSDGGEYLGVGMADALITRLSNLRQVVVRPTSSILRYTGAGQDPLQAGRELKVDSVVSGSIRRAGGRVRVTVQLVSTAGGAALWADKFDEEFTDIFTVEDAISERVVAALSLRLTGDERRALTRRLTENPEAHQLYLKGRYFWSKRTEGGVKRGIEFFQQAIEQDPNFALAYVGLADSYLLLGVPAAMTGTMPPKEAMPKARAAAERALAIDKGLAEAHASLGQVEWYEWDWAGAEAEFKRSVRLNPNYATARHWYALHLGRLGRPDEALAEIKRALELDPLSLAINANVGWVLYYARRYDEAIEQCLKTLEMDSTFALAHHRLGSAYVQKGMYGEAIAEFQKAMTYSDEHPTAIAALGHAYAASGNRGEARKVLAELRAFSERRYVPRYDMALIYAGLGEKEQALELLEEAYEQHDFMLLAKVEPRLDGLRAEPRFADLLRRVGLSP